MIKISYFSSHDRHTSSSKNRADLTKISAALRSEVIVAAARNSMIFPLQSLQSHDLY